jgi:hypothetical protein
MANSSRIDNQTPALKENMLLAAAAKLKAEDMAKRGYFAHNSPDGITPWYWLDKVGYTYSYAGENLAINFFDSQDVNNAWMNSPSHRANILSNKYSEMGIGIASGAYQGRETTFIVEFFGRPQVAKATVLDNPKPITLAIATTTLTKAPIATTSSATITDSKIVAAVKGESISNIGFSTWLFASPHTLMDWFYFGVAALIIISLMLAFFIKIKIQHPAILLNGLVLLLIVMIFIIINRYVAFNQTQIF